jgi:biofilm PGA synthesis N-glycosyltransferase PgaC
MTNPTPTTTRLVARHRPLVLAQPESVVHRTARISCIVPAYQEEESIRATIESLLGQTRVPDIIHVVVNNSNDGTAYEARQFAGPHEIEYRGQKQQTEVVVHDIGKNEDKKVGALNYGYSWSVGADFILGVDGDTILDKHCVEALENEMVSDTRIGGISAIYTIDYAEAKNFGGKVLIAGQRAQFAGFNLDNLLRGRNMAVLGGQASLLRVEALEKVMVENNQNNPWVTDSAVEDSLLSLQIRSAKFSTKISATARATVGGMLTSRALHGQQKKWLAGAFELMKEKPFHPNLRLRWREAFSMVFNISTRLVFIALLAASLNLGAFEFSPIWLVPPAVAWLLHIRTALSMKNWTGGDLLFAILFIPAEIYMIMRMNHFVVSVRQVMSSGTTDLWAAQASAESGKGNSDTIWTIVGAVLAGAVVVGGWLALPVDVQSTILQIGWITLGTLSVLLTLAMVRRLFRKHHGFSV